MFYVPRSNWNESNLKHRKKPKTNKTISIFTTLLHNPFAPCTIFVVVRRLLHTVLCTCCVVLWSTILDSMTFRLRPENL